jgi:hypothetical protein
VQVVAAPGLAQVGGRIGRAVTQQRLDRVACEAARGGGIENRDVRNDRFKMVLQRRPSR